MTIRYFLLLLHVFNCVTRKNLEAEAVGITYRSVQGKKKGGGGKERRRMEMNLKDTRSFKIITQLRDKKTGEYATKCFYYRIFIAYCRHARGENDSVKYLL